MIYGIEYFKVDEADMKFYKLPVTFTAFHERYAAVKRMEHIAKCLKNTNGITVIRIEGTADIKGATVSCIYYECSQESGCAKGTYKVELKKYETNPYF